MVVVVVVVVVVVFVVVVVEEVVVTYELSFSSYGEKGRDVLTLIPMISPFSSMIDSTNFEKG